MVAGKLVALLGVMGGLAGGPAPWPVAGPVAPDGGAVQVAPRVTVGVRPERVRVGGTFVVTVRVSGERRPDEVRVDVRRGAELVGSRERTSTGVGQGGTRDRVVESEWTFRATAEGRVDFASVKVVVGGQSKELPAPEVTVTAAGLEWGPGPVPRRGPGARRGGAGGEPPLLPEGVPPRSRGRTAESGRFPPGVPYTAMDPLTGRPLGPVPATPYGGAYPGTYPYGATPDGATPDGTAPHPTSSYGAAPFGGYGAYGSLPPGGGWAATAANDPWWPELLPELDRYSSLVEDPAGLARLEAGLTPERVFVGQQVTLVATATFPPEARYRMTRDPEFFPPGADNAWVVNIPYAPPLPAAAAGRMEEAHTFMRAFFPLDPGSFTVDGGVLLYTAGAGGYGRTPQDTLTSDALSVDVLPVPDRDAPPGWTGAVGRYGVRAWVTPEEVGWGESALLTLEVSGVGYVPALARPDPGPVWGGGLRPLSERAWVEVRDGVVGGVKRFSWLVVPVEPGPIRLGPVIYSFFDPYVGGFGQVATDELTVQVDAYPADYERTRGPRSGETPDASGYAPTEDSLAGGVDIPDPGVRGPAAGLPEPPGVPSTAARPVSPSLPAPGAWEGTGPPPVVGAGVPDTVFSRALEAYASGHVEGAAARWQAHLMSHPSDAAAWFDLGTAYAASRPGEGWAEWAWTSGLRHAPRDSRLRSALHGAEVWIPGPGLPGLPLGAGESLALATLLGLAGAGLFGAGLIRLRRSRAAGRVATLGWIAAPVTLFALAAVASGPWRVLGAEGATVVTVSGPVTLRLTPTVSAAAVETLPSGVAVPVLDRYGSWIRIASPDGLRGWMEDVQAVPLEPVRPGRRSGSG